ncbi:tetratricopeptide repeat protein [Sphingobium sp. B8D3C]|uniref:tetratricopeptide repeat protein n=1 Tax=Sphingobium sp. B8D3C TaxID=2940586 RepID=UPI0022242D77|nr:tetratricopeptide repeat protein [Sphingobium sp. B8D3C]
MDHEITGNRTVEDPSTWPGMQASYTKTLCRHYVKAGLMMWGQWLLSLLAGVKPCNATRVGRYSRQGDMTGFGRLTFAHGSAARFGGRMPKASGRGPSSNALAALLILAALGGCKSPSEQAAERAQAAEAMLQAGDLAGAQRAIGEAIRLREDGPNFQQLAGMIALQSGDPAGAYRAFQRALEFDATNRLALAYVANLGVQLGQIADAEAAADRLLTLEPDAMPALQTKGMIALAREQLDDAMSYADRILARSATDEAGVIVKARVLARRGQAEEAIALIDNALRVSGDSSALLTNKVNLYRYLGKPEPMAEALGRLVATGNAGTAMKLDRINLLYKMGRLPQAREANLALLREGLREPSDYEVLTRIWWEFDPTPLSPDVARGPTDWRDPLAVLTVSRYLLARGNRETANLLLNSVPDGRAKDLIAPLKLRLLMETGKDQGVEGQVESLLKQDPENVDALLLRAHYAAKRGDVRAALEAAQLALANDPRNPDAYQAVAQLYRARAENWRARQIYEEGLKQIPQNFPLVQSYMQYLHDSGDRARSMSVARNFARALPSSEKAWSLLVAQCAAIQDGTCASVAQNGLDNARTAYLVDDPPGKPADRGLFGRF